MRFNSDDRYDAEEKCVPGCVVGIRGLERKPDWSARLLELFVVTYIVMSYPEHVRARLEASGRGGIGVLCGYNGAMVATFDPTSLDALQRVFDIARASPVKVVAKSICSNGLGFVQ